MNWEVTSWGGDWASKVTCTDLGHQSLAQHSQPSWAGTAVIREVAQPIPRHLVLGNQVPTGILEENCPDPTSVLSASVSLQPDALCPLQGGSFICNRAGMETSEACPVHPAACPESETGADLTGDWLPAIHWAPCLLLSLWATSLSLTS